MSNILLGFSFQSKKHLEFNFTQEIGKLFLKVIKLKERNQKRKHKTTRNRKCVPFLTSGVGCKTRLKPSG